MLDWIERSNRWKTREQLQGFWLGQVGAVRQLIKPESADAKDGWKGCISGRVSSAQGERTGRRTGGGQEGGLAQFETGGV